MKATRISLCGFVNHTKYARSIINMRPVTALAGFAGDPQQRIGLDVGAPTPGMKHRADLAVAVADDDPTKCMCVHVD